MKKAMTVGLLSTGLLTAGTFAPVRLMLMDAGSADAKAFTTEYTQTITTQGEMSIDIVREARIRWRLEAAKGAGDSVRATVRFDSLRGSVSSPHGRQVLDLRTMRGTGMPIVWSRSGGPPRIDGAPPAADFGEMMGEPMPMPHFVTHAFPTLSAKGVQPGDRWEASFTRVAMDANTETRRPITMRYRLMDVEKQNGADVARIEVTWHGDAPAGTDTREAGAVDGKGFVRIGVVDGVVREVDIEETTSGTARFAPGPFRYRQTTRVRIASAGRQQP
jgi:hypothetical protein